MMNLASFKKIILGILLTLVIYVVSRVNYRNNNQKLHLSSAEMTSIDELKQCILNNTTSKFKDYLSSLSLLQTQAVIREMGLNNLTSETAQKQFLKCAGYPILQKSFVYIPPSHQHCKKMSFKSSGPVVALGSVPGSGNSWVRQLLESATGVYTGAVYCDKSYIEEGMIGEGVTTENVIAIKSHASPTAIKRQINYDKAIYIVRSPFGCILSENNRFLAKKALKESNGILSKKERHTLEIDYNYANNSEWVAKVKQKSRKWGRIVRQWLSVKEFPVLIVGYENLMNHTYTELKRMLDFIGYPYSEDDLLCTVKSSGEGFHRNHTKKYFINPYSPQLQEFVLNQIKTIDTNLLEYNISLYHPYTI